jgi:hypothetical protein
MGSCRVHSFNAGMRSSFLRAKELQENAPTLDSKGLYCPHLALSETNRMEQMWNTLWNKDP